MPNEKHSHYFKPVPVPTIDVYRVLKAFDVRDPCLQHAIKKLLVAGGRGPKDMEKDVHEAIDSLNRCLELREEERQAELAADPLGSMWRHTVPVP